MEKGTKVHYIPFEGAEKEQIQNGMVKSLCDDPNYVFVVYNCNNDWYRFEDYTGQRTHKNQLSLGWQTSLFTN